MLKKILIAAVAVVAGLVVVNRSSLIKALWHDAKCCMERQVPVEVQLKQLNVEIDAIDKDIKKNLSKLAAQEVDVKAGEERLEAMKTRQAKLRADITDMQKGLEARTEKVAFRGHKYRTPDLTRKLDMAVNDFNNLKEQVKNNEQLLQDKKRTLEAASNRVSQMRNKKEEFRLVAARLETQVEQLKAQQMASRVEVDDSQISRCNELVHKIKTRLATEKKTAELMADYGYNTPDATADKDAKTTDEVLKSARQALQDGESDEVVIEKK
jgi:predicted  nucleic acid-binding Zn-ribbon protein